MTATRTRYRALAPLTAAAALAACGPGPVAGMAEAKPAAFTFHGVETRLLDGELVQFRAGLSPRPGARVEDDTTRQTASAYAACAAAQYALIRGYGFARHLRTRTTNEDGIWRADAVYMISPALPRGLRTIDAEVAVADCAERGIPTV
ncbi:hypothetical protein [Phaeovulum vinaykumarii]|uniref:Lipoprotein n=1 Tax=Phaeovulum vinaykumarii TaxID=407234 RepID=A0A1N7JRN4_9RHOB|nr:hypothetical protein SAMN05421795_101267 [Phaeovulum vinaykumarii]SOB90957.1 hypothetical protein SAMN05878426_101267 [Phaeovulum vinaykumarii]